MTARLNETYLARSTIDYPDRDLVVDQPHTVEFDALSHRIVALSWLWQPPAGDEGEVAGRSRELRRRDSV